MIPHTKLTAVTVIPAHYLSHSLQIPCRNGIPLLVLRYQML